MDPCRTDAVLQFILALAGQHDEERDRELGPIHLLKYAYLADLAHAEAHGGETYTDTAWTFHHFGPWSAAVIDRIEPAVAAAGGEGKTIRGARYGDFVRYSLRDDALVDRLDARLPGPVVSAVRWAVHEFGNDTASLLRHVYVTRPMLRAAPGEMLAFEDVDLVAQPPAPVAPASDNAPRLSWKARKDKREAFERRREEIRERLARDAARRPASVSPPPRYDDVYFEGLKALDDLAGPPPAPMEGEAVFSPDIWKSPGRGNPDVP